MSEHIGKICPFCKTAIQQTDTVTVCPACGIPHHEGCWNENHGCTTFGCSEQHYEQQHTNPTAVCVNCGAPLGDTQAFCPHCGTPKQVPQMKLCEKCGAQLADGQAFCPHCGQRAGLVMDSNVNAAINQFNASVMQTNEAQKKKPVKIIIAVVAAVLAVALAIAVIPNLIKSAEDYACDGNFEKAYAVADDDKKEDIIALNNVVVCSAKCVDSLKDSKSFDLRDAWYKPENGYVVLKVAANNSYGNTVLNYWLYTYDHEDKRWELWDSYVDLEREEASSYASSDEKLEVLFHNVGITLIENAMKSEFKLYKDGIKNVNTLFANDKLHMVEVLDVAVPVDTDATEG